MKVTFFSNYLNHHQLPFCLEMKKKLGENFKFVATEKISEERLALGYDDIDHKYDFVLCEYEGKEKEAFELLQSSDFIIFGSAPEEYLKKALKLNKITFRYSERLYKEKFSIRTCLSLMLKYYKSKRKNNYLLCASAYAKKDFNKSLAYLNKSYKWGYFPEVNTYNIDSLIKAKEKNKTIKLLWVGRFIYWKHPETVLYIAKRLKKDGYKFEITMVGTGELFDNIKSVIKVENLEKEVILTGSVNNKLVRKYMEDANIFLYTSDQNEGWGAVLNESMNSGCAVVASNLIGSVPYLLHNNENGYIYNNNDNEDLYIKVKELLDNKNKRLTFGKNAYSTLHKEWNAKIASDRIIELYNYLKDGKKGSPFKDGPCSLAKNNPNKKE